MQSKYNVQQPPKLPALHVHASILSVEKNTHKEDLFANNHLTISYQQSSPWYEILSIYAVSVHTVQTCLSIKDGTVVHKQINLDYTGFATNLSKCISWLV